MREKIRAIEEEALKELGSASAKKEFLEAIRIKYLGRKGVITELFKRLGDVDAEEKGEIGSLINALKNKITEALENKTKLAAEHETSHAGEKIDITLPGVSARIGSLHPITKTINEICDIFISIGFRVVEGPEVETEYYNFEALNIPLEHPSRDAFDTFYIKDQRLKTGDHRQTYLLRSHTSPVQARFMEKNSPPFSIIVPGKVFRPDATDASHSFMFHQVEGLAVSEEIHFSDLKGVLSLFAKRMFGEKTKMRFRPSFFPFTEPSAEVDISCIICKDQRPETIPVRRSFGEGGDHRPCSVCGGKGWLEILGAGMVNPKVFKKVGYNPEKVTGFAFGMGVERIAMLKYGINDIRLFFENDVRFLKQF